MRQNREGNLIFRRAGKFKGEFPRRMVLGNLRSALKCRTWLKKLKQEATGVALEAMSAPAAAEVEARVSVPVVCTAVLVCGVGVVQMTENGGRKTEGVAAALRTGMVRGVFAGIERPVFQYFSRVVRKVYFAQRHLSRADYDWK